MPDVIKFRCKACDKKIAVRAEYAGKKAKCPGCKQPLRVPSPRPKRSSTGVPVAGAAAASDPGASSAGAKSYSLADLAEMEANAEVELNELSHKSRPNSVRIPNGKDCPACGASCKAEAVLCVHCGHSFEGGKKLKTKKSKEGAVTVKGAAAGTGKAVLGLVIASIVAIIFAVAWVGIVLITGYELGFVAWIMGGVIGFVTALIARTQSPGVGLAAAGISFAAWGLAKASLVGLILLAGSFMSMIDSAMISPAIANEMYEQSAFNAELMSFHEQYIDDSTVINLNDDEYWELSDKYYDAIDEYTESMTEAQIDAAILAYNQANPDTPVETLSSAAGQDAETLDLGFAIIQVFGLLDILWVFLMVSTAYKVASYGEIG